MPTSTAWPASTTRCRTTAPRTGLPDSKTGNRHGQRHRHRGERRTRRRRTTATTVAEDGNVLVDVLGQRLDRARQRVRPDADDHCGQHARRTAPPSSSPARSSTRRTPTTTAATPSPTRPPTTARPTAWRIRSRTPPRSRVTVTEVNDAPDAVERQRRPSPRTETCSSDVLANDSTGPGQRVRPDADRSPRSSTPGARHRRRPVRQGQVHAGCRLQRPRSASPTRSPTTAPPTASRIRSRTPPRSRDRHRGQRRTRRHQRQRRPSPRTEHVLRGRARQRLDRARPTSPARR